MKLRKKLMLGLASAIIIGSISQVAYAATISYSLPLPFSGTKDTASTVKQTNDRDAYNYADYIGWSGSTIICWIAAQQDSKQISQDSSYSGTGTVYMYYQSPYQDWYEGHDVKMRAKVSTTTLHACNISGRFNPS